MLIGGNNMDLCARFSENTETGQSLEARKFYQYGEGAGIVRKDDIYCTNVGFCAKSSFCAESATCAKSSFCAKLATCA